MKTSLITPCEEIKAQLMCVGNLVNAFQKKEPAALGHYIDWLSITEETLKKFHYSIASSFAAIKAELLAFQYTSGSRKEKKQQQHHFALQSIASGQAILLEKQQELEAKIEQVRLVLKQLIEVARQAGLLTLQPNQRIHDFMEGFLIQLQRHEQIGATVNNAIATIGRFDVLRLLAEEIEFT